MGIISVYLHPDKVGENMATMYAIGRFVKSYRIPYFIGGDWNMEPGETISFQWDVFQKPLPLPPRTLPTHVLKGGGV